MAERLHISSAEKSRIELAGLLHDIGMIGVAEDILNKSQKLTQEEFEEIKKHVHHSVKILEDIKQLYDVIEIIKYHHEYYDGNGYPSKLKGEEIPYFARIAAVADTFDAMTSKRTYRNAIPLEEVKEEIKRCEGTQFDPNIAETFLEILNTQYEKIQEIQEKY